MDLEKENRLIENCKNDLSQFKEIYNAYFDDVYRYSFSKLMNKEQAEDITSETFFNALEKIGEYKFENKSIKCWLFTIARNKILNLYSAKSYSNETLDETWQGSIDENILEKLADKEIIEKVKELIKTYKPPLFEIMQLKIWDEMTFIEIAGIIGKSESAIKMSYYRGLGKIKLELNL